MSLFEERKKRKAQERANAFIKKLNGKDIKDIEKMYLENIEFENNEIASCAFNMIQSAKSLKQAFY